VKKNLQSAFNTRQYMLSRDFEVFYYSDLDFQSVGSHSHDYYEFYFFVEGSVAMEIESRVYELSPGDLIIIPPETRHRALIRDGKVPYRRFVFWISRESCDSLCSQSQDYGYALNADRQVFHYDVIGFNTLMGKLFALLDEIHANHFGRESRIALCVSDLMLHIARTVYEMDAPGAGDREVSTYEAVTAFIASHLDEDLTLDRISGELFLSKFYLSHLFRENTGLSLHQYIVKRRLAAACEALRSGSRASEVCTLVGFSDYSSFFRAFRKEYGLSPIQFRAQYSQQRQ